MHCISQLYILQLPSLSPPNQRRSFYILNHNIVLNTQSSNKYMRKISQDPVSQNLKASFNLWLTKCLGWTDALDDGVSPGWTEWMQANGECWTSHAPRQGSRLPGWSSCGPCWCSSWVPPLLTLLQDSEIHNYICILKISMQCVQYHTDIHNFYTFEHHRFDIFKGMLKWPFFIG